VIGQTLGNYRVVAKLGEGGMGVVYRAQHVLIDKQAAIKVLLPELSRDKEVVERFFNEARSAALIQHPGIIEIFDFGHTADGSAYIVMELLGGDSLSRRLANQGPFEVRLLVALAQQLADVLGAAHKKGIVHRDLKPDNVFLVPDRAVACGLRVKVLDFGIAKLARETGSAVKTRTGSIVGTPMYMSPEQCRGAPIDQRADIYALGCIVFEMACGRTPFSVDSVGEIIAAHLQAAPPSPRSLDPALPPALDTLILRMLAKRPEDRPLSMDAVAAALAEIVVERPDRSAPPTGFEAASGLFVGQPTTAPGVLSSSGGQLSAPPLWEPPPVQAGGTRLFDQPQPAPREAAAPAQALPALASTPGIQVTVNRTALRAAQLGALCLLLALPFPLWYFLCRLSRLAGAASLLLPLGTFACAAVALGRIRKAGPAQVGTMWALLGILMSAPLLIEQAVSLWLIARH